MQHRKSKTKLLILCLISVSMISCAGPTRKVSRLDAGSVTDLSGRWNDTDARQVANTLIPDLLSKPWLEEYQNANGRKPIVVVGKIRNKSSEHIDTEMLGKAIEKELINSGKITFIASGKEREQLREEKMDQQHFASLETMKEWAKETGADHMLLGSIHSTVDAAGKQRVVYYQVNLELIHIEAGTKVWIGEDKIKKLITQKKYKW